ncbi:unnamed protein product [Rotaria sp. Silwood1]|nr:unnamed protein product [Rotaria sp. Silwood1]CAF4816568.1 unnamed protein product [Rotaria sp. Silwood1]
MILMTVIHLLLLLVALSSSITTSFEQFGLKIYSTVSQNKKNENIFVSPASISLAMSMCTVGAQQEILNQMLKTSNGKISKVALMHQREKFAYAESNDLHVQIVHVPYKSENEDVEFVFMVILPNRGVQLDVVEQKLLSHQSTRT